MSYFLWLFFFVFFFFFGGGGSTVQCLTRANKATNPTAGKLFKCIFALVTHEVEAEAAHSLTSSTLQVDDDADDDADDDDTNDA